MEDLEENEELIEELTEELWTGIEDRFHPEINVSGEIQGVAELKPVVDQVDELLGPMFGLNDEEIEYAKQLDTEYGRSLREEGQEQLPDEAVNRVELDD